MSISSSLGGFDRKRLRRWLLLFFFALLIPSLLLIWKSYSQLKWEAFHRYQLQAEALTTRINQQLFQRIEQEERRGFSEYEFLILSGDGEQPRVQRSALSEYPIISPIPGVLSYFQVDERGRLSTPLLPTAPQQALGYGIDQSGLTERRSLQNQIQRILQQNQLVDTDKLKDEVRTDALPDQQFEAKRKAEGVSRLTEANREAPSDRGVERAPGMGTAQQAFDQLSDLSQGEPSLKKEASRDRLGRVEDLKLEKRFQAETTEQQTALSSLAPVEEEVLLQRRARKELATLPITTAPATQPENPLSPLPRLQEKEADDTGLIRIDTFESEIDPLEFSLLDSGHFVLFRKVWLEGRRLIQGMMIEQQPLLESLIGQPFQASELSSMSELTVVYRGGLFGTYGGQQEGRSYRTASELSGTLLYRSRLPAPLADLELIITVKHLPAGPGGRLISWVAATLLLVLCGGFYLLYRLGVRQIELARQQQDFVSAVSHELKTPLTSIRMYGEMLREGWISEDKRQSYYDFIFHESERLSRLISNVLQLARMTRNEFRPTCRSVFVAELMDTVRSKVTSLVERSGYLLKLQMSPSAAGCRVVLDEDSFCQVMINLVDNAIKFSAAAEPRQVDILVQVERGSELVVLVRDYGPGVPRDQMRKIFKLFYRSESELTRETVGTGIGLALVAELVSAMGGRIEVRNQNPGAEFRLSFPCESTQID